VSITSLAVQISVLMASSRMPDNRQIDTAMEYTIEHSPIAVKKLSPDGQTLVEDFRCVLSLTIFASL